MNLNTIIIRNNKEPFKDMSHMNFRVYLRLQDGTEHEIPGIVSYELGVHATGTPSLVKFDVLQQAVVEV